ncbi:MAG: class II aldolase and adducin N-terminal domain-containing protein [Pseudomonadota bacterium]
MSTVIEHPAAKADPFWAERVDLACAFRLAYRNNWHEGVSNHFSLSVSEDGRKFLINPALRHFSRIRASELLLVDADDPDVLTREAAPEATAFGLHGGVHRTAPHARCALHVHSHYATALSTLADPSLPPLDQNCARFFNRVAFDAGYEGMAFGDEGERCAKQLGDKSILLMGNHGVLVCADTVGIAFDRLYYFERAARTVITAYATGRPLNPLSDAVAESTAQDWLGVEPTEGPRHFEAMRAILDEEDPEFRT